MIFAAPRTLTQFLEDSWYLFAGLLAVASLLVWLVMWLRTRLHDDTDHATSPSEMLKHFQDSLREGKLSEEEYRSIKSRLLSQTQNVSGVTQELGIQLTTSDLNTFEVQTKQHPEEDKDEGLSNLAHKAEREIMEKDEND